MPVRVKTEDVSPEPVHSSSVPPSASISAASPLPESNDPNRHSGNSHNTFRSPSASLTSSAFPNNVGELRKNDRNYDESDDYVVREMDVYLSPELGQQLYLLQYPLQHSAVGAMTGARIKQRHGMIELDQPLPELPKRHYDLGEPNLSYVVNRTFQSHTIPVETHMCLAKVKEVEEEDSGNTIITDNNLTKRTALHLVPLHHIIQMRPSLKHIDDDPSNNRDDNQQKAMEMESAENENDQTTKPLMFKRKESERAIHARKSSYAYKKASENAEEWQSLDIHDEESMEYQGIMDLVACPSPNQFVVASPDPSKTTKPRYIDSLNYMPLTRNDPTMSDSSTMLIGKLSCTDVKSVLSKITNLLRNGWPIPYSVLRDRFEMGGSSRYGAASAAATAATVKIQEDYLFQALSVCAVMVRGNFCLHSRFVALPRALQHVRTFILLLLQTRGSIQRERLQHVYEGSKAVSKDKLYVLLNQVAKRTARGWELRVEDDLAFVSMHPEQSELHLKYWEQQNQSPYFRKLIHKYETAVVANE